MDSRIAILGANGTGKSTLLHLITGVLQPCEGTISKHAALKLAKYSQHSADQLPYDSCPIEYFQQLFSQKFPEKDIMVRAFCWWYIGCDHSLIEWVWIGLESAVGSIWVVGCASDCSDQATLGWVEESVGVLFPCVLFWD